MPSGPTSSTERTERLSPARRRPLVLDAALRLLVDRESAEVSMDEIAAAAGVTKPVVYACFPSKAKLLQALLRREEQRMLAQISAALPVNPTPDDPEATLRGGLLAFLTAVAAEPSSWRLVLLAERGSDRAIRRRVLRGRRLQVEAVARLATVWLASRGVADAERKAQGLALAIVASAEAGARLILEDPAHWTPDGMAALLSEVLMHGAEGL